MNSAPHPTILPPGAVTGIGSLPSLDAAAALQSIAAHSPEIPFWPQLPRRSEWESMVGQSLSLLSDLIEPRANSYGYRVKDGKLNAVITRLRSAVPEPLPATFKAFEQAVQTGLFPHAIALKGQIDGPITVASNLYWGEDSFLSDPNLSAEIETYIGRRIHKQVQRLRRFGLPVLLFVDEPCLTIPSARIDAVATCLKAARTAGALAGLHCCAANPFNAMCRANPDILSFDADRDLESFFQSPEAKTILNGKGIVAYGLIPTGQALQNLTPNDIYARWLSAAAKAGDPKEWASRSLITATCGLGLQDESAVNVSFQLAREVGMRIRNLANS